MSSSAASAYLTSLSPNILSNQARREAEQEAFDIGMSFHEVRSYLQARRKDPIALPNDTTSTDYFQDGPDDFFPKFERYLRLLDVEKQFLETAQADRTADNDNGQGRTLKQAKAKLIKAYQDIDASIGPARARLSAQTLSEQLMQQHHHRTAVSR